MLLKKSCPIGCLLVAFCLVCGLQASAEGLLTFLGNTGYLLETGESKILIDGPSGVGNNWGIIVSSEEILQQFGNGQPPFDGIDLILISHMHDDHYDGSRLAASLQNNPDTVVIAPPDVIAQLTRKFLKDDDSVSARLMGVDVERGARQHMEVAGISFDILAGSHSEPDNKNLLHYAYLIQAGETQIFHSGAWIAHIPKEAAALGLDQDTIDIALLHYFSLTKNQWVADPEENVRQRQQFVKDVLKPGQIFLHHIFDKQNTLPRLQELLPELETDFPKVTVFQEPLEQVKF